MATIRVGIGSDFNISDSKVGIGTANPTALLEVSETAKADFNITGVTTLTSYGGFIAQNQYVNKPAAIGVATIGVGKLTQYYETETGFTDLGGVHHGDDQRFNTLSEDLVIDDGQILNITDIDMVGITPIGQDAPHNHSSYVCAGSLEQVSVTGHFSVPNGGSNDRQSFIEGTVRFNTDLNTLEFFNGNEWRQFTYNQGQSGRAIYSPISNTGSKIQTVQIHTLGNAVEFGERISFDSSGVANIATGKLTATFSSSTRGVFAGGQTPTALNNIDYVTIASFGNSNDFGDLITVKSYAGGLSSSTRGLIVSQYSPLVNVIEYVEIATTGNAQDFGDQSVARMPTDGTFASPTRGVTGGGWVASATKSEVIDYVTMASKGDTIDFGDLTVLRSAISGGANATRGIFMGGYVTPSGGAFKTIDYVTISSTGNAVNFGERTFAGAYGAGAASQTRMVCLGGFAPESVTALDYIQINTTGDSKEFGDALYTGTGTCGTSDCHGGLGGF